MPQPHDIFLDQLGVALDVRLVARLHDAALVSNTDEKYLHVFVPDLHLLSAAQQQNYAYGFNGVDHNGHDLFAELTTALLATRQVLRQANHDMTVTQLGDFVDLWRESANDYHAVPDILASYPDIQERFLPRPTPGRDAVFPNLLLGNHDLEAREAAGFGRARMVHYLPGANMTLMATHGDAFDFWELAIDNDVAAFFLKMFGGRVEPNAYPMPTLKELRDLDTTTPVDQTTHIQGDATFDVAPQTGAPLDDWSNVLEVHDPAQRAQQHRLLPNAVKTAEQLRTPSQRGDPAIVPNLQVMVIGHSHHARLIIDHPANLVLMDCGAWIENFHVGQGPIHPNRQIGAICGADLRIYQLDPQD